MREGLLSLMVMCGMTFGSTWGWAQSTTTCQETTNLPSAIVNGSVNVITGTYLETHTDLELDGPETLRLRRHYRHGDPTTFGDFAPSWFMDRHHELRVYRLHERSYGSPVRWQAATLYDPSGAELNCVGQDLEPMQIQLGEFSKGLTNASSGTLSGQSNLKNHRIHYEGVDRENNHVYVVTTGDGTKRRYLSWGFAGAPEETLPFGLKKPYRTISSLRCRLVEEVLPSGNHIEYSYDTHRRLAEVRTLNRDRSTSFSWIRFHYHGNSSVQFTVSTSEGTTAEYVREGGQLTEVNCPATPSMHYEYLPPIAKGAMPRLYRQTGEHGRTVQTDYYHRGVNDLGDDKVELKGKDTRTGRVSAQWTPVGPEGTLLCTTKFYYELNDDDSGSCKVVNLEGTRTRYTWDQERRLQRIDNLDTTDTIYRSELFVWSDTSDLLQRMVLDGQGRVWKVQTYEYDDAFNLVKETLYGNLSGHSPSSIQLDTQGKVVETSCERYQKRYQYSHDGFNLLIRQEEDNGHAVEFSYAADSNLLTARYDLYKDNIVSRTFYTYDSSGVVIEEIHDDGSAWEPDNLVGVASQKIVRISVSSGSTHVGLPIRKSVLYLDLASKSEILDHEIEYEYDALGHCIAEHRIDDTGQKALSKLWSHDQWGHVQKTIDPEGYTTISQSDCYGNLLSVEGPKPGLRTTHEYDRANRRVRTRLSDSQSTNFATECRYNASSLVVSSTDGLGATRDYSYDTFGRPISILEPTVSFQGSSARPLHIREYNLFDQCSVSVSPSGHKTVTEYNLYGAPTLRLHPDGSRESFSYYLDGRLASHTDRSGKCTLKTYAPNGEVAVETITSPTGETLSTRTNQHVGRHIATSSNDLETTHYQYDPRGRLVQEQLWTEDQLLRCVQYQYDSLSRRTHTLYMDPAGDIVSVRVQEFDKLDRCIEERTETALGTVLAKVRYAFDEAGNRTKIIHFGTDNQPHTDTTDYDLLKRPIRKENALGETSIIRYSSAVSESGNPCTLTTVVDPLNNQTLLLCDSLGRNIRTERQDAFGNTVSLQYADYDLEGNKTRQTDPLQSPPHCLAWEYGPGKRLDKLVEGPELAQAKVHTYSYHPGGMLAAKRKPDGVSINYSYDSRNRLSSLVSSDNSIHYAWEYDRGGNPVVVRDLVNQTQAERLYDALGNLTQETQSQDITVSTSYDVLGRITHWSLLDHFMEFEYDASVLKKAHWSLPSGQRLSHEWNNHDLRGKCHDEQGLGTKTYGWDALGRKVMVTSSVASYEIPSSGYDSCGNLVSITLQDPEGSVSRHYAYNSRNELTHEFGDQPQCYNYDSIGNRTTRNEDEYQYNELNQLVGNETSAYDYDCNGCLTSSNTKSFGYDALDRLVWVEDTETHRLEYAYDGFGRRTHKRYLQWSGSNWTEEYVEQYVYLGDREAAVLRNGTAEAVRLLDPTAESETGSTVGMWLEGRVYHCYHDHTGSIIALEDHETGETQAYRYNPFGELSAEGDVSSPWLFAGKYWDQMLGMSFFGKRFYNPIQGRWFTPDPSGHADGPNLYCFVHNSPFAYADFYGLYSFNEIMMTGWESLKTVGSWLLKPPGLALRFTGQHLLPIPGIRDLFERSGNFMLYGWRGWEMTPKYRAETSRWMKLEGIDHPDYVVSDTNGILNHERHALRSAQLLSDKLGGATVHYYYRHSQGFMGDIVHTLAIRLGWPTKQRLDYVDGLRELAQLARETDRTHLHRVHSAGAALYASSFEYLSKEDRNLMHVYAFGGAAILPKRAAGQVTNVIARSDFIPFLADPLRYIKVTLCGLLRIPTNTKFLDSGSLVPFVDHMLSSEPYCENWSLAGGEL